MAHDNGSRLERLANVGIIIVSLLASATLVKQWRSEPPSPAPQTQASPRPRSPALLPPGTPLTVPGVDWAGREQTLVLVLSSTCRYCTNSADFYRRVIAEAEKHGRTGLVAIFPQAQEEAHSYLTRLDLPFRTVFQAAPSALGLNATPTLLLVDRNGRVVRGWTGQLPPSGEAEVIAAL